MSRSRSAAKRPRPQLRVVPAPAATVSSARLPNRIVSVVLGPGEEVEWIWTSGPDGEYVSGYTIVPAQAGTPF